MSDSVFYPAFLKGCRDILKVEEAGQLLVVSPKTVYKLLQEGRGKCTKFQINLAID